MTPPYRIHLAVPDLGGKEVYYVNRALMHRQLTQGAFVEAFEEQFAAKLGVKHAVACSSGTAALHLALLAVGIRYGDKVLVPTLTYVATAAAVMYCKAIPVFGDADPETWSLNGAPNGFAELATCITVDLYGVPAIPVPRSATPGDWIQDACESLGATDRGRAAGTQGSCGVFSFYGNKILTTGEGGMVVTEDDQLAAEVRLLRGQGMDPARRYYHTRVGYNYRMTELSAAIGLAQLERLDEMLAIRYKLLLRYREQLAGVVTWQTARPGTTVAPWVFACLLPALGPREWTTPMYPTFRNTVMATLAAEGIETRPTFPCVSGMPPYAEFAKGQAFPVAEDIAARGIVLPLHTGMGAAQVDEICATLRRLL